MGKEDFAVELFQKGFRCSQAVLEVFAEKYGMDVMKARMISTMFGGGSALGGACGAVNGALLVLGLEYGVTDPNDKEGFSIGVAKTREFADRFKELHGEITCHGLIGLDVFSEEGLKEFRAKDMRNTHCNGYVRDAVRILKDIMN